MTLTKKYYQQGVIAILSLVTIWMIWWYFFDDPVGQSPAVSVDSLPPGLALPEAPLPVASDPDLPQSPGDDTLTPALMPDKSGADPLLIPSSHSYIEKMRKLRNIEIDAKIAKAEYEIWEFKQKMAGKTVTSRDVAGIEHYQDFNPAMLMYPPGDLAPEEAPKPKNRRSDYDIQLIYLRSTEGATSGLILVNGIQYDAWSGRVINSNIKIDQVAEDSVTLTVHNKKLQLRPGTMFMPTVFSANDKQNSL